MDDGLRQISMVAGHLRLAVKELRWAAAHLSAVYEAIRTEENEPMEDPNQLKLFEEEKRYN